MWLRYYPNPFTSRTYIKFELPGEGLVTLEVFDTQDRHVTTLLQERKPAGQHVVASDGCPYEPGLYFYRISTGDTILIGKMLPVK